MVKKHFAALVLALVLAACFVPGLAFAADDGDLATGSTALSTQNVTAYDLWVGGVQVTSANASNITGSGISGKVSYNASTSTLTLNGATITGAYSETYNGSGSYGSYSASLYKYGIYQPSGDALTIKLVGSNKIKIKESNWDNGFEYLYGISAIELVFTGGGTLSVVNDHYYTTTGIECGPLTVNSGTTVKVTAKASSYDSTGIQTGRLTLKGTLTTSAHAGTQFARALIVHKIATVAKGAKLTAKVDHGNYGMDAIIIKKGAFIVNGRVNATADESSNSAAYGITCRTLSVGAAGDLTAYGTTSALSSGTSVKLTSKKTKVLAGSSGTYLAKVAASKIDSQRYVSIFTPKANPMTAKAKKVTFTVSSLKNKSRSVSASKAFTVKKAKGKVTYKVTKYVTKSAKGKVTVASNGKVTVKKGTTKGTYKLKVKVTAAGTLARNSGATAYASISKTLTLTVRVK